MSDYEAIIASVKRTGAVVVADELEDIFPRLDETLAKAGATWSQVVRTWFYIKDIDAHYARFNELRTAHFARRGMTKLPASTGIGLRAGPAVTAALLICDKPWSVVKSPRQTEATTYGSSFSRAAVCGGNLYVSGTASLAGHDVAHVGDFDAQVKETLAAVESILSAKGKSWRDVKRAIAYVKHGQKCSLPCEALVVEADVCRPEWLFELEVDA